MILYLHILVPRARRLGQSISQLKARYTLTGGHNLYWFLGVEVIRDRQQWSLWLSQSSYIDKIFQLTDEKLGPSDTPMACEELLHTGSEAIASYQEVLRYQRKVGSILYAACI